MLRVPLCRTNSPITQKHWGSNNVWGRLSCLNEAVTCKLSSIIIQQWWNQKQSATLSKSVRENIKSITHGSKKLFLGHTQLFENHWTKAARSVSCGGSSRLFMGHITPASCGRCAPLNCVFVWVLWSSWRFMCSACIELFAADRCRGRFRRIGGNRVLPRVTGFARSMESTVGMFLCCEMPGHRFMSKQKELRFKFKDPNK